MFEESEESLGSDDASGSSMEADSGETLSFWDAIFTHINTVKDIRLRDEIVTPSITGMSMLDSGELILCDNANAKVKFLDDASPRIKYDIRVESAPFDIAHVNDDKVVVTLPEAKKLQFIIVKPGAKLDKTIDVSGTCFGITVHENNFYVCMAEKGVHILTSSGILKKTIPNASAGLPKHICLNPSGTKIYISGGSDKEAVVSCMTKDGHGLLKFTDNIQAPTSLSVDKENDILLLDSAANKVYVIHSIDGHIRCLLSKETKRYFLTSMGYNSRNRHLAVAEIWNSKEDIWVSKLKVFRLDTKPKTKFGLFGSLRQASRK